MNIIINGEEWTPGDLTELVVRDQNERGRLGPRSLQEQLEAANLRASNLTCELSQVKGRLRRTEGALGRVRRERNEARAASAVWSQQCMALQKEKDVAVRDYEVQNEFREAAERERDASLAELGKTLDERIHCLT